MSETAPLVSVVIPSYNAREFLESAVQSVEAQSFRNYEIIVVDDGSTDETPTWAAENTSRFRYFRQSNQGQAAARNYAAWQARGEFLAFLDADDMWLPEKLARQVEAFEKKPERSFVFTDGYRLASTLPYDQLANLRPDPQRLSSLYTRPPDPLTLDTQFRINCVPTSSLMTRRQEYLALGGMPLIRQGEDFVLTCLLLLRQPAIYLDEPMFFYRVHNQNLSAKIRSRYQSFENIQRKDSARLLLSQITDSFGNTPPIAKQYTRSPILIRLFLLLIWRISYGSSRKKILSDLIRYLKA